MEEQGESPAPSGAEGGGGTTPPASNTAPVAGQLERERQVEIDEQIAQGLRMDRADDTLAITSSKLLTLLSHSTPDTLIKVGITPAAYRQIESLAEPGVPDPPLVDLHPYQSLTSRPATPTFSKPMPAIDTDFEKFNKALDAEMAKQADEVGAMKAVRGTMMAQPLGISQDAQLKLLSKQKGIAMAGEDVADVAKASYKSQQLLLLETEQRILGATEAWEGKFQSLMDTLEEKSRDLEKQNQEIVQTQKQSDLKVQKALRVSQRLDDNATMLALQRLRRPPPGYFRFGADRGHRCKKDQELFSGRWVIFWGLKI